MYLSGDGGKSLALERGLSDLVNAAYGLTPEEVALMWRAVLPRMPLDPQEELPRLAHPMRRNTERFSERIDRFIHAA